MEDHSLNPAARCYIDRQTAPPFAAMPFGRSTVGHAGCELIACYNALTALGQPLPFAALLAEAEQNRLLWRRGRWGMRPGQMRRLLARHGVAAAWVHGGYAALEARFAPGDLAILTTWNRPWWRNGVHTYLCLRLDEGWRCLNNRHRAPVATLEAAARGHRRLAALAILQGDRGQAL